MTKGQKIALCRAQVEKYEYLKLNYHNKIIIVNNIITHLNLGKDVPIPSFILVAPLQGVPAND